MDDVDEFFGGNHSGIIGGQGGVDEMLADMVFDDLGDEPLQSAAAGRRLLEHPSAFAILLNGAFNRLNLSFDPLDAIEKFDLLPFNVSHETTDLTIL